MNITECTCKMGVGGGEGVGVADGIIAVTYTVHAHTCTECCHGR